ncbi:MAG: hypothetical protein HXY40_03010 [Chloroflexi bacterium]|nr:hypothetical protein [Chloroflexota bacterium]
MAITTSTLTKPVDPDGSAGALWRRLVQPSAELTDIGERHSASLFCGLLLVFAVLGIVIIVAFPLFDHTSPLSLPGLLAVGLMFVPYALGRTRHYRVGVVILLTIINLTIFYSVMTSTSARPMNTFYFMVLTVVLAGILFSVRGTVVTIIFTVALMLVAPFVHPDNLNVASPISLVILVSCLVLVLIQHRNSLERERQAELRAALQRAENANSALHAANAEMLHKNQELARANALAKEHARLKSEFMATMSHELRTPLNAIRGFCGIMLEGMGGEIDEEARHMVGRIDANGTRLLTLINDVLDIAKIEAGRMEIVNETFAPRDLVKRWQTQMSVLAAQKNLTFEVQIDPQFPDTLIGDPERLTQVAVNLLSNAFKFTEKGGVKLEVRREEATWEIVVSDSGIGIPPHAINFIFDEFRQVDGSSKRSFGGSGLGLAIVRNLCRMMDGSIKVSSVLGQGSTFTVTLPLQSTAEPLPVVS